MNDYIEMEVEVVEELEDEYFIDFSTMDTEELREKFCHMKGQIVTLTNFLVANFRDEIRCGKEVPRPSSVEVAVRLLGELKERRQRVENLMAPSSEQRAAKAQEILARLRARLAETWERRRVETLRDALSEANSWRSIERGRRAKK